MLLAYILQIVFKISNLLEKELELLKHYTYINQIRFGEKICININVDDNCLNLKLIIQTFVENVFFHAFPNRDFRLISIFITKDTYLTIEIIDNGVSMQKRFNKHSK